MNAKPLIREMELKKIRPAEYNPREIGEAAFAGLRESIKKFGLIDLLVWNKRSGKLVAGHQRLKVLLAEGVKSAPVIVVDFDEVTERAANVSLNSGQIAGQWTAALAPLLEELRGQLPSEEFLALRLDELRGEIAAMEQESSGAGATMPDDVPEPPKVAVTKPGDLWLLGNHRLLCGDSTNAEHVARLMAGEKAGLMATDPPYGVSYDSKELHSNNTHYDEISCDDFRDAKLQSFLESAFGNAKDIALVDNAAWYLWHAMLTQAFFAAAAAAAAAVILHRQIIWMKPQMIFGHGDYHWKHELCFYGWRKGHRPPFYGERNQVTTWAVEYDGNRNEREHPTQKPTGLFTIPISNHTKPGELLYDPFLGSGTTLIAAEQLGRRCFGMEIEPRYCDVIVKRWEEFTGKKATLENGCAKTEKGKGKKART